MCLLSLVCVFVEFGVCVWCVCLLSLVCVFVEFGVCVC